jgi:hypothetical protein
VILPLFGSTSATCRTVTLSRCPLNLPGLCVEEDDDEDAQGIIVRHAHKALFSLCTLPNVLCRSIMAPLCSPLDPFASKGKSRLRCARRTKFGWARVELYRIDVNDLPLSHFTISSIPSIRHILLRPWLKIPVLTSLK